MLPTGGQWRGETVCTVRSALVGLLTLAIAPSNWRAGSRRLPLADFRVSVKFWF